MSDEFQVINDNFNHPTFKTFSNSKNFNEICSMNKKPVIAIDGFSSTGKSSISKVIAQKLDLIHIDTGALYRGITYFALENCLNDSQEIDIKSLFEKFDQIHLEFILNNGVLELFLNGKNIDKEIRERVFSIDKFAAGVRRFMIGFSMKVLIADTLAPVVALGFSIKDPSFSDAWIACGAYTLQLFFDFAGYSAMAIGLGLMLGFHFAENFNHPYLAVSIQDFWRRWHMTLSSWLRDYLYISLGGNRYGLHRTYVNLMLTMAIGGLWHGGDNWNYLIWGIIQGAALCCDRMFTQAGYQMPDWLSRLLTLIVVMLAWTVFRAENFDVATHIWAGQFGLNGFAMGEQIRLALRPTIVATFVLGILCVVYPAAPLAKRGGLGIASWSMVWPALTFIFAVIILTGQQAIPFLYFQF